MSARSLIAVTAVLLCIALGLVNPAQAARVSSRSIPCCTTFNKKPIPPKVVVGYRKIPATRTCRMEAIIFYTIKENVICARPEDEWVKPILELLSLKLRKLAKPATDETQTERSVTPAVHDGSGPFSSTTDINTDSTEGFYF
ncbi:C-C motif chemokine 5-like [Cheilinus undulatus]|uniref:C-C motif chemokine 5-like n=1 Tax=Cheilinus undulatus TaxID=241271 RepID=UPI001BD67EEA|nr:C-C motif chemokine 5-like [Cheilinus undulatus]